MCQWCTIPAVCQYHILCQRHFLQCSAVVGLCFAFTSSVPVCQQCDSCSVSVCQECVSVPALCPWCANSSVPVYQQWVCQWQCACGDCNGCSLFILTHPLATPPIGFNLLPTSSKGNHLWLGFFNIDMESSWLSQLLFLLTLDIQSLFMLPVSPKCNSSFKKCFAFWRFCCLNI